MKTLLTFCNYLLVIGFCLLINACRKPKEPTILDVTVIDNETSKPIQAAFVKWTSPDGGSSNGITDANGRFVSNDLGANVGIYSIEVTANGYDSKLDFGITKVPVGAEKTTSVPVKLIPELPLLITPATLNFNDDKPKTVYFKNRRKDGNIVLDIKIAQNDQWIKVSQASLPISANNQQDVTVIVDSKGRGFGSYNGIITLSYSYNNKQYLDQLNVYMNVANPEAPSVATNEPTGITQTSANVIGILKSVGGSAVTDRGILWWDASEAKPENPSKHSLGPGEIGEFPGLADKLSTGKKYSVQAYAKNSNGTGLGEVRTFTTSVLPTHPSVTIEPVAEEGRTETSVELSGAVTNNGGSAITEQGFCSSTNPDPKYSDKITPGKLEPSGKFTATLTGLTPGVQYYVRAYALNSLGKADPGYSSNIIPVKTSLPGKDPDVDTENATDILETSVKLHGKLNALGSSPIDQHGFCWSTTNVQPTVNDKERTKEMGSLLKEGDFEYTLTGLTKGMNYYVRAYVTTQDKKTKYGPVVEVITAEDRLVVYYPFNGNMNDVSGNGNNASGDAKLTADVYGNPNRAYDLSRGAIKITNASVGIFKGNFTMSFRVKTGASSFTGNKKVLISKTNGACNGDNLDGFMLYTEPEKGDQLNFKLKRNNSSTYDGRVFKYDPFYFQVYRAEKLVNDKWDMVTIVKDGPTVTFYLNGSFVDKTNTESATNNTNIDESATTGNLTFGSPSSGFTKCPGDKFDLYNGFIDDFRLYSFPMADAEVKALEARK